MTRYTCKVSSGNGEAKPTDPSLGCDHPDLGHAVWCAALRNQQAPDGVMRTYAARQDGTAWSMDEIPAPVKKEITAPLVALSEGRYVNDRALARLVALGLIRWVPNKSVE